MERRISRGHHTQFREDFSLDVEATQRVIEGLLRDGVSGLIVCGTVGENCSLTRAEKVQVMRAAKEVVRGRVPILAGIAEFTTAFAIETAREAEKAGMDGIMVMPALVYSSKAHETIAHYEGVAKSCGLPIMVYNNPPIYRTDVTPEILTALTRLRHHRRLQRFLRRYPPFHRCPQPRGRPLRALRRPRRCRDGKRDGRRRRLGLRPLNAFPPRELETFFLLAQANIPEAMPLYEWFMPLLRRDARPDLVQCIKLCEEIMGRGSALTRPPRLALAPDERAEVEVLMERALAARPRLPDVGLAALERTC